MSKIYSKSLLILFSLLLSCSVILAGDICPECYHMVWGVIWDLNGYGWQNKEITISGSMGTLTTQTNSSGIYSFNFYKDFSGKAKLSYYGTMNIQRTDYVELKNFTASRVDFDENMIAATVGNINIANSPISKQVDGQIVYVTSYGDKYHRYGCKHLYDSCKPIPLDYVTAVGSYSACEDCW